MIETKEQYEIWKGVSLDKDAIDLIEALREVARAGRGVVRHWDMSPASEGTGLEAGYYDHLGELRQFIDALPDWITE